MTNEPDNHQQDFSSGLRGSLLRRENTVKESGRISASAPQQGVPVSTPRPGASAPQQSAPVPAPRPGASAPQQSAPVPAPRPGASAPQQSVPVPAPQQGSPASNLQERYQKKTKRGRSTAKVQKVLASVLVAFAAAALVGMIGVALNGLKKDKEVTLEISSSKMVFSSQPSNGDASASAGPSAAQGAAGKEDMPADSGSEAAGGIPEANDEQEYTIIRLSQREDLIIEDTLYGREAEADQVVSMHSPEEDIVIGNWRTQAGSVWHDCFKFWVGGDAAYSSAEYVVFSLKDLEAQTALISIACGEYSADRCQSGTQMFVCIYVDGVLSETVSDVTDDPAFRRNLEIDVTGAEELKITVGSYNEVFGECIIDAALRCN